MKSKGKRVIALLLALITLFTVFSFSACGKTKTKSKSSKKKSSSSSSSFPWKKTTLKGSTVGYNDFNLIDDKGKPAYIRNPVEKDKDFGSFINTGAITYAGSSQSTYKDPSAKITYYTIHNVADCVYKSDFSYINDDKSVTDIPNNRLYEGPGGMFIDGDSYEGEWNHPIAPVHYQFRKGINFGSTRQQVESVYGKGIVAQLLPEDSSQKRESGGNDFVYISPKNYAETPIPYQYELKDDIGGGSVASTAKYPFSSFITSVPHSEVDYYYFFSTHGQQYYCMLGFNYDESQKLCAIELTWGYKGNLY